ncbi:MAG: GNAT family N-acetyltransferase [Micropepsaceae bacterium]
MIVIRQAEKEDAAEVAEVFIASQADALPFLSKLHTPDETRDFIVSNVFVQCEVWIAVEDRKIVGMMAINRCHIDHLYLQPGYYRRGAGTRLLNQAKKLCPDGLTLFAFEANTRACAFYTHHGFVATERGDGSGNEAGEPDILFEWSP